MPSTRVLDLFAGLGGWSQPWRDGGHDVFSVDIDEQFDVDLHADVNDLSPLDLPWLPDVVLASPPCEHFSVLTIGKNWEKDGTPKTEAAYDAYTLALNALRLTEKLTPDAWLFENPRAKLRVLPVFRDLPRQTVWYCRYGMPYAKPTDLFGVVPGWTPRPECHNGNPDHISAPRGSTTGVQGGRGGRLAPAEKAKIPYELAKEVMDACLRSE